MTTPNVDESKVISLSLKRKVDELTQVPAIKSYLERIGGCRRSMLKAAVIEKINNYPRDIAVIYFERDGTVVVKRDGKVVVGADELLPKEQEAEQIKVGMAEVKFPEHSLLDTLFNVPEEIAERHQVEAGKLDKTVWEFRNWPDNKIVMLLIRHDNHDGGKDYFPYTYWDDQQWRKMEPPGLLPLWGLDQLKKGHTTAFIHEGAKKAEYVRTMVERKTPEARARYAAHPWAQELSSGGIIRSATPWAQEPNATHLAFVGGAYAPYRTDWSPLIKAGIQTIIIVSDNDKPGLSVVKVISRLVPLDTYHIQFTSQFRAGFDLADQFPAELYQDGHYNGPAFEDCLHPATWVDDVVGTGTRGDPKEVRLRNAIKNQWAHIDKLELFVNRQFPHLIFSERALNTFLMPFSSVYEPIKALKKHYSGRHYNLAYRPDLPNKLEITDEEGAAINIYRPSKIKAEQGDVQPFLNFLAYLIPIPKECKHVERWIATLYARPQVHMLWALFLRSRMQGVGKTLLGEILSRLVGRHNTSWPNEHDITTSAYNSWLGSKRLIINNEIYAGHSWKAYNKLKECISDKTVTIHEKYVKEYTI